MAAMDFWVSVGSTYSYLSVMRIDAAAEAAGVAVRWRVFNVRTIMVAQDNIPFRDKPVKQAYMWRDIARRAARHGLPVRVPAPYPLPQLELANRVGILGLAEGWGEAYLRETWRRWMVDGQPAGESPNLDGTLAALGLVPRDVVAAAESRAVGEALEDATDAAMALGIFGSPSFVVGAEVFWGDDRLEDALDWAAGRATALPAQG